MVSFSTHLIESARNRRSRPARRARQRPPVRRGRGPPLRRRSRTPLGRSRSSAGSQPWRRARPAARQSRYRDAGRAGCWLYPPFQFHAP